MTTKKIVSSRSKRRTAGFSGFKFTENPIAGQNGVWGDFQTKALKIFNQMQYPTMKDEAWRRTDIKNLDGMVKIPLPDAYASSPQIPAKKLDPLVGESQGGQISILPDGMDIFLDQELDEQGVIFTDLITASEKFPEKLEKALGQIVKPEDGKFAALTAAFVRNGIFVYVPEGITVEKPLHSVFWAVGEKLAHFSHLIIWLEEGASLTFVGENASPNTGSQSFHGGIVEIYVGPNASLKFVELQSFGDNIWNFSHERAKLDKNGRLDWIFGAFGSQQTKSFMDIDLVGDGAEGRMSGFYFSDGNQHLDHDTQQNHLAPHTTSDLLFKGALKGNSRSVWQGMIYVAPGAQQIDGYQANRNLLLSDNARADSIPGLEILADDVRCTHGATVGKIDPDLVFYLRSRGIVVEDAERLIVEGFFEQLLQRIPFDGVRQRFRKSLELKMNG